MNPIWITPKSFDLIHLSLTTPVRTLSATILGSPVNWCREGFCGVFDWCDGVSAVLSSVVLDLRLIGFETAEGSTGGRWLGYTVAASHAFELAFAHHFHRHPYFSIVGPLRRAVGGWERKTEIWLWPEPIVPICRIRKLRRAPRYSNFYSVLHIQIMATAYVFHRLLCYKFACV